MTRYIILRLIWAVVLGLGVTLVAFAIFFLLPSVNPATRFAGSRATPQVIAEVTRQFGLNKPFYEQYGIYVKHLFLGDRYGWPGLGFSYNTRASVRSQFISSAEVTVQLVLGAAFVWLLMGIGIGVLAALRRRTIVDRLASGFCALGMSIPAFWLGLMMLLLFWQKLHVTPGTGYVSIRTNPAEWFGHLVLPWLTLAFLGAAVYARVVRGNLLDVLEEDYIRTARAKGLRESTVIGKHGLKASLTPVLTMFGMDIAVLLSGAVIIEEVFNLPGLGLWTVQSGQNGDLPVLLALVVVSAWVVALTNLAVDIAYGILDPRVRIQ